MYWLYKPMETFPDDKVDRQSQSRLTAFSKLLHCRNCFDPKVVGAQLPVSVFLAEMLKKSAWKEAFVTNCLVECNYSEWNPARAIAVNISTLAESFQGAIMTPSGQDLCFISQWKACKSTAKNHQPREITFLPWICKLNIWAEKEGTCNRTFRLLEERCNPESQCLVNESVYCIMSKCY